MNSIQTTTPLLLVTGMSQSGKNSLRQTLNETLSHLTHIIRSTKTIQNPKQPHMSVRQEIDNFKLVNSNEFKRIKELSKIEADHPEAFAANHENYDGDNYGIKNHDLEEASQAARKYAKKLAVAFVDPVNLDKVKKTYETNYGGKAYTALLKATHTPGVKNNEALLKLNKDSGSKTLLSNAAEAVDLKELDVAAEDRVIRSRMTSRGISEDKIDNRIKAFTEPEQKNLNKKLANNEIDFVIQNLDQNPNQKEKSFNATTNQIRNLINIISAPQEQLSKS